MWETLRKGNGWSHLSVVSLTIELVSNASLQLFPNNTVISFTIFVPEQVNLDGQWEVASSEVLLPINVPKQGRGRH